MSVATEPLRGKWWVEYRQAKIQNDSESKLEENSKEGIVQDRNTNR